MSPLAVVVRGAKVELLFSEALGSLAVPEGRFGVVLRHPLARKGIWGAALLPETW